MALSIWKLIKLVDLTNSLGIGNNIGKGSQKGFFWTTVNSLSFVFLKDLIHRYVWGNIFCSLEKPGSVQQSGCSAAIKTAVQIYSCPIHVVTFTLISNLVTDYIQKRREVESLEEVELISQLLLFDAQQQKKFSKLRFSPKLILKTWKNPFQTWKRPFSGLL